MITAARPITIAPRPMLISAKPWYWLNSAPENATSPLEIIRPSTRLKSVLIPCARDIRSLHPVARREHPSSVPKNQYRNTNQNHDNHRYQQNRVSVDRHIFNITKRNQQVEFINIDRLIGFPIIFKFTEYSPSCVRIPARIAGFHKGM